MARLKPESSRTQIFEQVQEAAEFLVSRIAVSSQIAMVLGSGLGSVADELDDFTTIPYQEIPHFARSTAIGHAGRLVAGTMAGIPIVAMQGRFHLYEGYTPQQVAFPMWVFSRVGIQATIITNAAGGINPDYSQGRLVLIKDHINLQGQNPLAGMDDGRLGLRFIDMTNAYDDRFRQIAVDAGRRIGIELMQGIYAGLQGPSYETPAEIRFLRTIGADLVGMSTVPEVIAARQSGIRVVGISCVTNMAAGILDRPILHEEVLETGRRVSGEFNKLLRELIPAIANEISTGK